MIRTTANHSWAIQTPTAPTIGIPTAEIHSGTSMCLSGSASGLADLRAKTPLNALMNIWGLAKSETMLAQTSMATPGHKAQVFKTCPRLNSETTSIFLPEASVTIAFSIFSGVATAPPSAAVTPVAVAVSMTGPSLDFLYEMPPGVVARFAAIVSGYANVSFLNVTGAPPEATSMGGVKDLAL